MYLQEPPRGDGASSSVNFLSSRTGSRSTGATSNRVRFAGSVSCFTSRSIAIDRARRSARGASDRSEVFRLQANDVTWPGVACVCKSMKLGMHSV